MAAHINEVAFMTVEDVAEGAGVSPATVVRFSMELGYAGYSDLGEEVRRYIKRSLSPLATPDRLLPQSRPADAFRAALLLDQSLIEQVAQGANAEVASAVVSKALSARRVWVAGFRSMYSVAYFMAWSLQFLLDDVRLLEDSAGRLSEQVLSMNADDVLIAFSFPRYYRRTVMLAQHATTVGTPVVAITDNPLSPVGRLAALTLLSPYRSVTVPGITATGAMAIANGLLAAVMAAIPPPRKDRVAERVERMEALQSNWSIWDLGSSSARA